jgi:uncharacterized protein (DUF697 family)
VPNDRDPQCEKPNRTGLDPEQVGFKETLKRVLDCEFDRATEQEKRCAVDELVRTASAAATVVTLQPLPFLDYILITPIQIGMVQGIARVRGYHLDKKAVLEIVKTLRASLVTQHVVIGVAKIVPTVGWLASASMAHALTYAIGELSDRYFREGRSMLPAELRDALNRLYREQLSRVSGEKWRDFTALFRKRRES